MSTSSWGRQVDKDTLLGKKNYGQVSQSNKLGTKLPLKPKNKIFRLESGSVTATFREIEPNDILNQTKIHPLNPRNQDALDDSAVESTLESIRKNGIDTDCLGIWSDDESSILIIEGSVRRYCAIKSKQSYPIWILPAKSATNKDIRRLIADASDKKPHSLRERGEAYWKEALELSDDAENMTNEQLSQLLSVGRETLRKALQAFHVDIRLLKIMPNYEGVANNFYPKLAKIEKQLLKKNVQLDEFINEIATSDNVKNAITLSNKTESQQIILSEMERVAYDSTPKKIVWKTDDIVKFEQKNKFARKSISPNGESVRFELGRIDRKLIENIELIIKKHLS
ncbi:hypothetical protein LQM11_003954 [Vibrio parahaemolyticus]|nr:hypothetical protein [Vibrio parahaemolyticus]